MIEIGGESYFPSGFDFGVQVNADIPGLYLVQINAVVTVSNAECGRMARAHIRSHGSHLIPAVAVKIVVAPLADMRQLALVLG